jgi:hypothetical protein
MGIDITEPYRLSAPKGRKDSARGFNPGLVFQPDAPCKWRQKVLGEGIELSIGPNESDLVPLSGHIPSNSGPGVKTPG